jgi:hypothetical protein
MTGIKPQILKSINLFLNARLSYLIFFHFVLLVYYIPLTSLNRVRSPFSTFAPVKSFIQVSFRTDDKMYNCKTVAISFIYFLIVLMIYEILNVNIYLKSCS